MVVARLLLLENPHTVADKTFDRYGFTVERIPGALPEDELIEKLQDFDVVGIRSKTHITKQVLAANPHLTAIGAFCIGTNQIDLHAATEQGVAVFNAPYSNTRSVVEMVISEIIALMRQVPQRNAALHRGVWNKSAAGSHEVRGKTLGIIGYGSIGSQLSVVAEALGMRVVFFDLAERLAMGNAQRAQNLAELLEVSDVVSLHIDGRPENNNLFDARKFELMKDGAYFINLARGHTVDLPALRDALASGKLAGAGIDVFPTEPNSNGDFSTGLEGMDNVILTPHIGGSTLEAQESIGRFVSQKLSNYLRKGETEMSVNFPNIAGSPAESSLHRVGWMHRNTPGALAYMNKIFADHGANITYQSLATTGEYGYMVMDTAGEIPDEALQALAQSPAHIRTRIMTRDH